MKHDAKFPILRYIGASLGFILIAAYIVYHLFFNSVERVVTELALPINEKVTVSCDAYIFRNELLISGGSPSVSASYYYKDGAKVPKYATVAAIFDDGGEAHGSTFVELEKQIDFLEKSNIDHVFATSDTANVDRSINEIYYELRSLLEQKNISGLSSKAGSLLTLLNRRAVITGEIKGFDDKIESLKDERDSYASFFGNSQMIKTDRSGYFYAEVDGYESRFTSEFAEQMTYDEFSELIRTSPDDTSGAIGKLAYEYKWYLACPVGKNELKGFTAGKNYDIIFESNSSRELSLYLYDTISDSDGDGAILLFMSLDSPEGFEFTRMQPVKIVESSVSGIKVPVEALRIVDGVKGVYILYGSRVYFCTVDIISQNENYYIVAVPDLSVTPYGVLCVYDNIIVKGKGIEEGMVIN